MKNIAGEPGPSKSGYARDRLYRSVYPLRVLGLALAGLIVASVLYQDGHLGLYGWLIVPTLLLWPHIAYLHARLRRDPYRAEVVNLLIDSAFVGMWIALMQFNLLPSVVLAVITTHDKFITGVRHLWLYSFAMILVTMCLAALLIQPQVLLESSFLVVVCTLPLIVLHYLAVSAISYKLIRKVARQNIQLQEARQRDFQTSLLARAYWQELAQATLLTGRAHQRSAWLLMIDIDHFKSINDTYGHTVGDEAIRAVGHTIRDCVRAEDCAGRYGGDEFSVLCGDTQEDDALAIAQRIRAGVAAIELPDVPGLRLTSSIGMAPLRTEHLTLRDWLNAADAALYRAKAEGRDQVAQETPVLAQAAASP